MSVALLRYIRKYHFSPLANAVSTHIHIQYMFSYIYNIYIHINIYVCVCVCVIVGRARHRTYDSRDQASFLPCKV